MSFQLQQESYLMPSPAGTYYCVAENSKNAARSLLRLLLLEDKVPLVTNELIESWFPDNVETGLQTLHHLQKLGWLQEMQGADQVNKKAFEDTLPAMLGNLSTDSKALLADSQGLCLASTGFVHESTEEISALGADLVILHSRHRGLLNSNLKYSSTNWGLLDAAGHSQLGFWPLYVGEELFSLAISSAPCLHHQAFFQLVWMLHNRYA